MNYNKIFKPHHIGTNKQHTVILHGSSGFGKTATVESYAEEVKAKLVNVRLSHLDSLNLYLPYVKEGTKGSTIATADSELINTLYTAKKHTVVFLDEFTNPSSKEIYNVFKELLCERTFNNRKISKHIQFIAATNLTEEDNGVVEMPDSLWKRMTHVAFAPDKTTTTQYLAPLASEFFTSGETADLIRQPITMDFSEYLDAVPRQIDATTDILENNKGLSLSEMKIIANGRLGSNVGIPFATFIHDKINNVKEIKDLISLPNRISVPTFADLATLQDEGEVLRVIGYLQTQIKKMDVKVTDQDKELAALYNEKFPEEKKCTATEIKKGVNKQKVTVGYLVADFLRMYGIPEVTTAIHESTDPKFVFLYERNDDYPLPWQHATYQQGRIFFGDGSTGFTSYDDDPMNPKNQTGPKDEDGNPTGVVGGAKKLAAKKAKK